MNGSKHPVFGRNSSHTISLSRITVTFLSVYMEGAGEVEGIEGETDRQRKKK